MHELSFAWLELTGKCQLSCGHCYAESGPTGGHGEMAREDWLRVLNESAALGVRMVQFIGGEPTLYPSFRDLVTHALGLGLAVEVFTNLVHVSPGIWQVFGLPGVRLATSYYTDLVDQHEAITGRSGSHRKTMGNIAEALRRSIPLRVGVIDVRDDQRVEQARSQLAALGLTEISADRLRQVGRGVRNQEPSLAQLCGGCGNGKIAISPSGEVWPCVFSRWMPVGNVRTASLEAIVTGARAASVTAQLSDHFGPITPELKCVPKMCDPDCGPNCSPACNPSCWPHGTGPCGPKGGCKPNYE